MIDYSRYWIKLRTIRYTSETEFTEVSYEFNLIYKQIKSFESVIYDEKFYTLVKFDDRTFVVVNRDIKRFRAEVMPKYNDMLNEFLSKHSLD